MISCIRISRQKCRCIVLHNRVFVFAVLADSKNTKAVINAVLQVVHCDGRACAIIDLCAVVRVLRCASNLLDDLDRLQIGRYRVCPGKRCLAFVWGQHHITDLIRHCRQFYACNRPRCVHLVFVLAVVGIAPRIVGALKLQALALGHCGGTAFVHLHSVCYAVWCAALFDYQHHACKVFVRWICPCKDNARRFSFWCARLHIAHLRRQRSWRSAAGRSPAPAGGFVKVDGHHLASLPRIIERRVGALIEVVGGVLHHDHIALDKGAWHLQGNGKNSGIPHREQRRHLEAPACFQHRAGVGKVGPARCPLFELLKVFYQFLHIRSIGIIRQVKP